jgi:hypothetical protein
MQVSTVQLDQDTQLTVVTFSDADLEAAENTEDDASIELTG